MNTPRLPGRCAANAGYLVAMSLFCLATIFAAEPAPAGTLPEIPKTHVLFMGADISLERDKEFHPVEKVTGASITIRRDGTLVRVPMEKDTNLQIHESLKLARASIAVDNLKSERAYAPGSDPFEQLHKSVTLAAGESAVADIARGDVLTASINTPGAANALAGASAPQDVALARASLGNATAAQQSAETAMFQAIERPIDPVYDVGTQASRAGADAAEQLFDAIRLSFEITSDRELKDPYYVVIAQILPRGSKPGHARKWAYMKSLAPMNAGESRKVTVYQGGLPPGYLLESCEAHLYEGRDEFATNLSRRRIELTEDEALEFRIIEYVGANKGRTLPAAPAIANLATDVRASLAKTQFDETFYVRVARDGRVTAAFSDAAGKKPLKDDALETALKTLRFKPALEAGKPVESIAPIRLGELASL
ncbi:MAG TPA: hypothetical protein VMM36_00320 [Opitutaceae bacterium]|nr:hypothetical protein [Opitutaceae bacterium]